MARLEYTRHDDAAYVWFREGAEVYDTKNLDGSRLIDYDASGDPIGVELLDVSKGVNLDDLPQREVIAALLAQQHIPVFA